KPKTHKNASILTATCISALGLLLLQEISAFCATFFGGGGITSSRSPGGQGAWGAFCGELFSGILFVWVKPWISMLRLSPHIFKRFVPCRRRFQRYLKSRMNTIPRIFST